MSFIRYSYIVIFVLFFASCSSGDEKAVVSEENESDKKISRFSGNYNRTFNDLHDLHFEAAVKNGITPLATKDKASQMGEKLVFIPKELPYYKTDSLTHSCPYLVSDAAKLLMDICVNFSDSLESKGMPPYKLVLTSLTRTDEDIKKLTKRNVNASHNSAHCYGTTFDISWRRFVKLNPNTEEIKEDKLKFVLGQVLHNMREQERCYIKHERKQACFHITVR